MSCENKNITGALDLGCFGHCNEVCIPIPATQTGVYFFNYECRGMAFSNKVYATIGNNIHLNNVFNENSQIIFSGKFPDGTTFTFDSGGVTYDTFQIRTKIKIHAVNENYGATSYQIGCECTCV